MAPSTPPPPPDTSNTAATTTRPVFQNPPRPPNSHPFYSSAAASRLPSNPNPNYPQLAPRPPQPHPHPQDPSQLLYPVASSGRGFLSRPVAMPAARPSPRPPFVFPYLDQGQGNPGFVRANHFAHVFLGPGPGSAGNASSGGVMPGVVKGIPVPPSHPQKVGPPSASISDNNGHKDLRDKNKDDSFAIIRDRKVRISENASLYTLCRSWLRNGFPEETQQPQYLDAAKSLPRPLPVAAQVVDSPDKKSGDKEEEDEDESSVENLSEKELLQRHIKRAKRVRSRLREERLQRITRYKTRLALLLPPMVEQHFKNESAVPN
ncbi:abl interactor 2 isoform X1 [Sesamum indicum]|uniref:Abl interactor 2 isoform X1 n=1 Tax=Sesamum indicum TaxID=4182 RepID=A0A6I9U6S6_SESIN|nr:abl interactor 2 isoform X1 [Sesamum indicum]